MHHRVNLWFILVVAIILATVTTMMYTVLPSVFVFLGLATKQIVSSYFGVDYYRGLVDAFASYWNREMVCRHMNIFEAVKYNDTLYILLNRTHLRTLVFVNGIPRVIDKACPECVISYQNSPVILLIKCTYYHVPEMGAVCEPLYLYYYGAEWVGSKEAYRILHYFGLK